MADTIKLKNDTTLSPRGTRWITTLRNEPTTRVAMAMPYTAGCQSVRYCPKVTQKQENYKLYT